jgi:hypothetical protein
LASGAAARTQNGMCVVGSMQWSKLQWVAIASLHVLWLNGYTITDMASRVSSAKQTYSERGKKRERKLKRFSEVSYISRIFYSSLNFLLNPSFFLAQRSGDGTRLPGTQHFPTTPTRRNAF